MDIDWASLQQDVRPKAPSAGSALNRYKGGSILAQIGVSKQYAGEELFNKIQNECIKQEPGNIIIIRPSLKILTYIFDQKSLGHSSLENY